MMKDKNILKESFKRMHGSTLTTEWLDSDPTAMTEPIIIEQPDGLGMEMPDKKLTIGQIADTLGRDTPVEVIGNYLYCAILSMRRTYSYF